MVVMCILVTGRSMCRYLLQGHACKSAVLQEVTACGAFGYVMLHETLCDMPLPLSVIKT